MSVVYLKRLFHNELIVIQPTDGLETLANSVDVFNLVDPKITDWGLDVPGPPTPATPVTVHELVHDGTFAEILGSLGDTSKLCLWQSQMIAFFLDNRYRLGLRGHRMFSLLDGLERGEFVGNTSIRSTGGSSAVGVQRFSYPHPVKVHSALLPPWFIVPKC